MFWSRALISPNKVWVFEKTMKRLGVKQCMQVDCLIHRSYRFGGATVKQAIEVWYISLLHST